MQAEHLLRPSEMLAKPVHIDPAFEDPDRVIQLCRDSAPYRLAAAVHKRAPTGKDVPWFRVMWAIQPGQLLDPGAEFILNNPRFIEAAKESFSADIIIPMSLMNNVNAPMGPGIPHLDLPFFRGVGKFPFDLLVAMNYSGLFHEWAIPIASTISWFYSGCGGEFDYWPDGPEGAVKTIPAPARNIAVVSDNEYMYHRINAIGREEERMAPGAISRDAILHANSEDSGWTITDGDKTIPFTDEQIRISILWKAYAFKNEVELAKFRDHTHDLTMEQTLQMMHDDLKAKGRGEIKMKKGFEDPENRKLITTSYLPPEVIRHL
ncbi:hypothetical protein [Aurantivibrio plasticivorans]